MLVVACFVSGPSTDRACRPAFNAGRTRLVAGRDALVAYRRQGKILAVATIYRDKASLQAEVCFEQGDQAGLQALLV